MFEVSLGWEVGSKELQTPLPTANILQFMFGRIILTECSTAMTNYAVHFVLRVLH